MLPYVLPCKSCGLHLKNNLDTLDKALENKESLLNWLLTIRNSIAIEQKRKTNTIIDNFNEIFNKNNNNYKIYFFIVLLIVLIIIYFIYFYAKHNNQ